MYRMTEVDLNKTKMAGKPHRQSGDAIRPTVTLVAEVLEARVAPATLFGPANLSPQNAFLPVGYLKY